MRFRASLRNGCKRTAKGVAREEGGDSRKKPVVQDGERGGSGTNSSRRMRDNVAHPRSLICIHPVPFPAETTIFCIYRLPRQYLTGARRSTRLRGDVEMRIFRAAFRLVLMDRSRKSSSKESIFFAPVWIVREFLHCAEEKNFCIVQKIARNKTRFSVGRL